MTPGRRSMLLMVAFVALWAAVEALAARLTRPYSPYQVVFTRYVVHVALMAAVWGWRDPASLLRTRRPLYQLARSLLMLSMPASFIVAVQRGLPPAAILSVFWLVSPLLVLVLARLALGERAPLRTWIATAVACAGAAAVFGPGPVPARLAPLPVAMAASFALYVAMTRSLRTETTRANLFYTASGVALVLAFAMPRLWVTPPPRDLAIMAGVGVLGFACLWALDRMAAAAPVSKAAPLACLQAGFAVGLDAVVRREPLVAAGATAAGLSLVGAAALYAWVREPAPSVA